MQKNTTRLLAFAVLTVLAITLQHYFGDLISFSMLQTKKEALQFEVAKNQWLAAIVFSTLYVLVTTLSLPMALSMTLAAGLLFGFLRGLCIVSFASTIGATLAFMITRSAFGELSQNKFGKSLQKIQIAAEGREAFYLLSLRLMPIFPFFIVNIGMAFTKIRTPVFCLISFFGMLPASAVFVNAGVQVSRIQSLHDVLTPQMILAFFLLGALPLVASWRLRSNPPSGERSR